MDTTFDPTLPSITRTTLEQFISHARFARQGKKITLFVVYGVSIFGIKEQSRGKLTASPEDVLTNIYNAFNKRS